MYGQSGDQVGRANEQVRGKMAAAGNDIIQPKEALSQRVTIRARPSEVDRIDAAAEVAGVTRSRILRQAALRMADAILGQVE